MKSSNPFAKVIAICLLLFTTAKITAQDQTFCFVAGSSSNFTGYEYTIDNTPYSPTDNNCQLQVSHNYSFKFSNELINHLTPNHTGGVSFHLVITDDQNYSCVQQDVNATTNWSDISFGCNNASSAYYKVSISQVNFNCGDFGDYDFDLEINTVYACSYTATEIDFNGNPVTVNKVDKFSETTAKSTLTLSLFCPIISPLTSNICLGQSVSISASGWPDSSPGYSWSNNFNGTNPPSLTSPYNFTPTAAGTYVYSLLFNNNGVCGNVFSDANQPAGTATIHVSNLPTLNISPSLTENICSGQTASFQLSGSNSYNITGSNGTSYNNVTSPFNVSPAIVNNSVTNVTYNITGINNGYCTAQTSPKTVTVDVAPVGDFSLSASPVPSYGYYCPGTSITLTAHNLTSAGLNNSYVWSTGASNVNSITVAPNVTTTYYCSVTGSNGCVYQKSITINIIPNFTPAQISVPYAFQCEGVNDVVTIAVPTSIAYQSYLWTANNGATISYNQGSSVYVNCANATGDVTLGLTAVSQGCPTSTSIVIKQCCKAGHAQLGVSNINIGTPSDPLTPTYTTLNNASLVNNVVTTNYYVTGNLYFTGTSTISGVNMIMNPGSSITIDAGATLNITNSHIYACSDMWNGINFNAFYSTVSPYTIQAPHLNVTNSLIEDAITGVNIAYSSFITNRIETQGSAAKPVVSLSNAWFNRCAIGLLADYDPLHPDSANNSINNYTTTQYFNGGVITASNCVFSCLAGLTMSNVTSQNYNTSSFNPAYLHNYLYKPNFYTFCGIAANSSSFVNNTINSCHFDNLVDGILSFDNSLFTWLSNTDPYTPPTSNLSVTACSFQRAHLDASSDNYNLINNLAYARGNYPTSYYSGGSYYFPYGFSTLPSNLSDMTIIQGKVGAGINFYGSKLNVGGSTATSCTFTNSDYGIIAFTDGGSPVTITTNTFSGTSKSGIYMTDINAPGALQTTINGNLFTDHFQQAITLAYANGSYDAGTINVTSNTFSISAGNNSYWQSFYQTPATNIYAPEAIFITGYGGNTIDHEYFSITSNIITGYEKCIRANTATRVYVVDNTISNIPDDAQGNFSYGVFVNNCSNAYIVQNTISSGYNNNVGWQYNQIGIYEQNSPNSVITCNTVNGPDVSIKCAGSNSPTQITGNALTNAAVSNVWLDVNCVIGPQGSTSQACGDKFSLDNPYGSELFTTGGTNGSLSPFYYRNTGNENIISSTTSSGTAIPLGGAYALAANANYVSCTVTNQPPAGGRMQANPATTLVTNNTVAKAQLSNTKGTNLYGNHHDVYRTLISNGAAKYSNDNILAAFMDDMGTTTHAALLATDTLLANAGSNVTEINKAYAVNNSFSPTCNYDAYIQKINNLYIAYKKDKKHFTAKQIQDVRDLAVLCPFEYGESVYKSRALLRMFDATTYTNPCENLTIPELVYGANNQTASVETTSIAQQHIKVYPNPANNNLYIDGLALKGADDAEVQIYNSLGQLVLKSKLNNGITTIEINSLTGGSYFYKILQNSNVLLLDKLIILK